MWTIVIAVPLMFWIYWKPTGSLCLWDVGIGLKRVIEGLVNLLDHGKTKHSWTSIWVQDTGKKMSATNNPT